MKFMHAFCMAMFLGQLKLENVEFSCQTRQPEGKINFTHSTFT